MAKAKTKLRTEKVAVKKISKKSKEPASYKLSVGDKVPDFMQPSTAGSDLSPKVFSGQILVLFFYPKDNTPGCTLEGRDFARLYRDFKKAGAEVVGISRDSLRSHEGFKAKCEFPFELISDEDETMCRAFDVIQMKSLYGRKFEGIERATFVVSRDGQIAATWRKVKVTGHAEEVLNTVCGLPKK